MRVAMQHHSSQYFAKEIFFFEKKTVLFSILEKNIFLKIK
jgi:hypothetical protein